MKKTIYFFCILLVFGTILPMDRVGPRVDPSITPARFSTRMPITPFGQAVIDKLKDILEQDKIDVKDVDRLHFNLALLEIERLPVREVFEELFVPHLVLLKGKSRLASIPLKVYGISTSGVLDKAVKKIKAKESSLGDYLTQLRGKRCLSPFLHKILKACHATHNPIPRVDYDKHPELKPRREIIDAVIKKFTPKSEDEWYKYPTHLIEGGCIIHTVCNDGSMHAKLLDSSP